MKTTTSHAPNTNIYKYTADIKYALGKEVFDIETTSIRTIAIDNDYNKMNMPMIFITLGVYRTMANRMILNQDKGIFILDIKRCISNSDMPDLYSDYISDKFIYFITGDVDVMKNYDNKNTNIEAVEDELDDDTVVTIGLLSLDHVNKNKRMINGVISGKLSSIMYYLTSHFPILIEPPRNNVVLSNKLIPPINSVSKSLEYLNSLNVFYSTPYRFFIDFDKAYLISSSGKPVKAKGEDIGTVMISVYHYKDDQESKIQGMVTNKHQSLYELYVSSSDCELSDNSLSEKSFSKISATTASGVKIDGDLTTISSDSIITTKTKSVRISNDNNGILGNMIASIDASAVQILVQKTDIDSAVLTMNKEYIIKADDAYGTKKYNGRYLLVRKRELYVRDDDTFTMSVMLLFKKVPENKNTRWV